jgi:hypothetical protein
MDVIIADKNQYRLFYYQKKENYALLALLVFSFGFGLGLPARTFVLFFPATDELVLSSSLAIAAGVESAATFRSESALLCLRRLRLDSAGVSMMLSSCAAASEELGTSVDGVLRAT